MAVNRVVAEYLDFTETAAPHSPGLNLHHPSHFCMPVTRDHRRSTSPLGRRAQSTLSTAQHPARHYATAGVWSRGVFITWQSRIAMSMPIIEKSARSLRLRLHRFAAACALIIPIAACTGQNKTVVPMNASPQASNDTPPLRTLNPAPRRAFEVRVTLDGAPGPFASVTAVAQYDVSNEAECGRKDELAGVFMSITSNETVTLRRVSETEYAGVVYADGIVDEDYYGRGVCHWELTEARVVLQAGKDEADTRFVADLPASAILGQGARTRHFWKGYYPRAEMAGFREFGNTDLKTARGRQAEDQRDAFFSITLTSTETTK